MKFNEQLRTHALRQIVAALEGIAPQEGETGVVLYARMLEAVNARSRMAHRILVVLWTRQYRTMASVYCLAVQGQTMPGWKIRPATAAERAESVSKCAPSLSWICHEPISA